MARRSSCPKEDPASVCLSSESAEALEKEHVHRVYDQTAHHFRDVRFKAWPRVRRFLCSLEPGSLVADIGCGPGKYLQVNSNVCTLGCDHSVRLAAIAHTHGHEVAVCDNLRLPYRDACFDAVISIGVIHHLTTAQRRVRALRELSRVLRPGGHLMVYVWAMEQKHRKFKGQDVLVPWNLKNKPCCLEDGSSNGEDSGYDSLRSSLNQRKDRLAKDQSDEAPDCRRIPVEQKGFKRTSKDPLNVIPPSDNNTMLSSSLKDQSLPQIIWQKFQNLIRSPKEDRREERNKSLKYEEMLEYLKQEEEELSRMRHRPPLEHSLSAPESHVFAVREFPGSSRPHLCKHLSFDPTCDSPDFLLDRVASSASNGKQSFRTEEQDPLGVFVDHDVSSCHQNGETDGAESKADKGLASHAAQNGASQEPNFSSDDSEQEWVRTTAHAIASMQSQVAAQLQGSSPAPGGCRKLERPVRVRSNRRTYSETSSTSSLSGLSSDSEASEVDELPLMLEQQVAAQKGKASPDAEEAGLNKESCEGDGEGGASKHRRYYHVFREGELPRLVEKHVADLEVLESYYDHANWCIVAEKVCTWKI